MTCERITLPNGGAAIICGLPRGRAKCRCGRTATLLCDWKLPHIVDDQFVKVSGTCDAPLCPSCTSSPAPNKDLCPKHAAEWLERREAKRLGDPKAGANA